MDMLITLIVVIISHCIYILKHHVLYLEYVQYIPVSLISIKWMGNQMQEKNNCYKYAIYLNIAIIILNMNCLHQFN